MLRQYYSVFILLFFLNLKPQLLISQSKVYYMDGSILIGEISSWNKDSIELILTNSVKISIPRNSIKKVRHKESGKGLSPFRNKGYYVNLNFGIHFNQNVFENSPGTALHFSTGYILDKNWRIGIQSGLEKYNLIAPDHIIPLCMETQYAGINKFPHLYLMIRSGYGFVNFPIKQRTDWSGHGGIIFHPAIGLRYRLSKFTDMHIDFGMLTQKAFYAQINQWIGTDKNEYHLNYKRLIFRLGINI